MLHGSMLSCLGYEELSGHVTFQMIIEVTIQYCNDEVNGSK